MKGYLVLALAGLALAIAAPSAFATRVIFDPPSGVGTGQGGTDCTLSSGAPLYLNDYTPCNVSQLDTAYSVEFVDCSTLTGIGSPTGWCLFMDNTTGKTLESFTFKFTAPAGGSYDGTDVLTCSSSPADLATNNCPNGTSLTVGQSLDLSFFGPIANNENFYLITDFKQSPGYADVTVTVPEPGVLGMFGFGLLALGVGFGWQRRRQTPRGNQAV